MTQPTVYPKGKAKKMAEKADYRAVLFSYIARFVPVIDGTSGVRRMEIEQFDSVKLNGIVVNDVELEIKPGDVVSAKDYEGKWHDYVVTPEQIEQTW